MESNDTRSPEAASDDAKGRRLSNLARWSVTFGVAGLVVTILYKRFGGYYPYGENHPIAPFVVPIMTIVLDAAAIALGCAASGPANIANRPLARAGLILGVIGLLIMIFVFARW